MGGPQQSCAATAGNQLAKASTTTCCSPQRLSWQEHDVLATSPSHTSLLPRQHAPAPVPHPRSTATPMSLPRLLPIYSLLLPPWQQ
jgi:hypothetical protein